MKQVAVLLITLISTLCYGQSYSRLWKDLNYAGDTLIGHRLDIYLPQIQKPSYPVVISIYGSAWFSNNSKGADLNTLGKALLEAGFAVITPNHRSSLDSVFPAPLQDIKAAIRFIRANAAEYNLDNSFIGITGSSSGGNLAAMAGTSREVSIFTYGNESVDIEGNVGPYTAYSSSIDAVVDWYGPTHMLVMDSCGGTDLIHDDSKSPESVYIGGPIQENKNKCQLANPVIYINPGDPPFLIFHGDNDRAVPYCQSEILYKALLKSEVPAEFYLIPGGQHGPGVQIDQYLKLMTDFFVAEYRNKLNITK